MKIFRKITALCCAAALMLLASGCTERIRQDDVVLTGVENTISLGVYRAFQVDNTGNAYNFTDSSMGLFEQTLDGKPVEQWINDSAKEDIRYYVAIEQALRELGALELTAEEKETLEKNIDTAWNTEGASYYYGDNGVTQKSFETYMYYRSLEDKLFNTLYGDLSDEDILDYTKDNVYMARFAWVLKKASGMSGADSMNASLKSAFEGYKKQYDAGKLTFEDILDKENALRASDPERPAVSSNDTWVNFSGQVNLSDEVRAMLDAAKPGDAVLAPDAPSNMIYFFALYTEDEIREYLSDAENRAQVLEWMQVDSFNEFVQEKMDGLSLSYDEDMLSLYTATDIVLGYEEEAEE